MVESTKERLAASERGHADHGWLKTHHSFSFANYYNPSRMGFGPLRVINQDRVAGGGGFGWHPHRDMEIISYVLEGALAHRDTTGGEGILQHGDVQVMSAGTGVYHTEMNGRSNADVHFLQVWLLPRSRGATPRYADRHFALDRTGLVLIASHDGRGDSLTIGQDVDIYRVLLTDGEAVTHRTTFDRAWVQLIGGDLEVAGEPLLPGDGLALTGFNALEFSAAGDVEALLFELGG